MAAASGLRTGAAVEPGALRRPFVRGRNKRGDHDGESELGDDRTRCISRFVLPWGSRAQIGGVAAGVGEFVLITNYTCNLNRSKLSGRRGAAPGRPLPPPLDTRYDTTIGCGRNKMWAGERSVQTRSWTRPGSSPMFGAMRQPIVKLFALAALPVDVVVFSLRLA